MRACACACMCVHVHVCVCVRVCVFAGVVVMSTRCKVRNLFCIRYKKSANERNKKDYYTESTHERYVGVGLQVRGSGKT